MGRWKNRKNKSEAIPDYDWPFEISFKLNRNRPKVAFLSGVPRDYYPDDPGFSKFGLTYCLPFPDDTAKPNYLPSSDRLQKPISLKGYGIGGLSAPRFAPLLNQDNPAPNTYQSDVVPPRVKKSEKLKRIEWKDFVKRYEDIVEKQCAAYESERLGMGTSKPTDKMAVSKVHSDKQFQGDRRKEPPVKLCKRKFAAFGMGFANTRFPKDKSDLKLGVGTYAVDTPALKTSFQITTPEGKLVPRVRIVCHPSGSDICMTCGLELIEADYYQTKSKFKVQSNDKEADGQFKLLHLSLCRECYCDALKWGCYPWTKEKIPETFIKARHCNCVHDHQEGHAEFLMKSTCKGTLNLARRELIYSRYFKDAPCEKMR